MFNKSHECHHRKEFKDTFKILQKKLPPAYKVKTIYVDDPKSWAEVDIKEDNAGRKYFELKISTWQCEDSAIEALHHEWAHMLSWPIGNNWHVWQDTHGPEWGIAFAKIYQVLYEK